MALDPQVDLRRWARFWAATAIWRVRAGIDSSSIDDAVDRAAHRLAIAGNPAVRIELDRTRAELLIRRHQPARALEILQALPGVDDGATAREAAGASRLRGRALEALGRIEEASDASRTAAHLFGQDGSTKDALAEWEHFSRLVDLAEGGTARAPADMSGQPD
ncbi:hypothetical protein [Xylanimonas sp. McL0601]|uniref:hypothetical protein n=1 Tax=Xylanimonas sp. McL0601 TaxID=3414739 RepID=UPI003CE72906